VYAKGPLAVIVLIQRVLEASVAVNEDEIARIGPGLLALVGFEPTDTEATIARMLSKITRYRVFPDDAGKMNIGLLDAGGSLLLVPQFTLAADTRRGLRPSFSGGAAPTEGARLFDTMLSQAQELDCSVGSGQFGADMQVHLVNDGPVTFWLQDTPT